MSNQHKIIQSSFLQTLLFVSGFVQNSQLFENFCQKIEINSFLAYKLKLIILNWWIKKMSCFNKWLWSLFLAWVCHIRNRYWIEMKRIQNECLMSIVYKFIHIDKYFICFLFQPYFFFSPALNLVGRLKLCGFKKRKKTSKLLIYTGAGSNRSYNLLPMFSAICFIKKLDPFEPV